MDRRPLIPPGPGAVPRSAWSEADWGRWAEAGFRWIDRGATRVVVDGPGLVTAEAVQACLDRKPAARWWTWTVAPELPSTMPVALRRFTASGTPTAVLADMQTAGRGRRGRTWVSAPGGGLHLSLAWRAAPTQLAGPLMLAAGVVVAESLSQATGAAIGLKWPNDGLIDGRKCFGLLAQARGEPNPRVVLGIGVNVNGGPSGGIEGAISLEQATGRPWPRACLAAGLAAGVAAMVADWASTGPGPWLQRWRSRNVTLGRTITVLAADSIFTGDALDIRADGALLVRRPDGRTEAVTAGDVSLRPGPPAPAAGGPDSPSREP